MPRLLILTTTIFLIALCSAGQSAPPTEPQRPALQVVNQAAKSFDYELADLAKFPQRTVMAKDHKGELATYTGVSLAAVLQKSDIPLGSALKGPALANFLLIEAHDKYTVLFSLPEVDPDWTDNDILLATSRNGEPLDATHGPLQLIAPRDKRQSRWVKQVIRLSVRTAPKPAEANSTELKPKEP